MITNVNLDAEHRLSFQVSVDGRTVTATYPRVFVEDEINENPSTEICRDYLDRSAATIVAAVRARLKGEYGSPPFNAVRVR